MLKDEDGKLLTQKQEHDSLVSYSKGLCVPEQAQPPRTDDTLPLVFTLQEVYGQLRITKVGKAVPARVAPAAAWKVAASEIAPLLQQALEQHALAGITLPSRWTDAWIVWLPKPGKAPSQPPALRSIGLMSPEAKVLAALKERPSKSFGTSLSGCRSMRTCHTETSWTL